MKVAVEVEVDESAQVRVGFAVGRQEPEQPEQPEQPEDPPPTMDVEESMAFKVGVVEDEDGGPPRLSIELDGRVIATFPQTEQGRTDFWNHMDTIRVAQATGSGLQKRLQRMKLGEQEPDQDADDTDSSSASEAEEEQEETVVEEGVCV